jgi:two-component system, NtrC family, sensor histidine kinase KinB
MWAIGPQRLRTRFVVAGCLFVLAAVASGAWGAYTVLALSRVIEATLRAGQQRIDLTATLANALEREDDALLLAITGAVDQAQAQLRSQRALFDATADRLARLLTAGEEQAVLGSLRANVEAYRAAGDALLARARDPHVIGLYHASVNPVLRRAVRDAAALRTLTFGAMERASLGGRQQARRAIGVMAGVSLLAVVVSTLGVVHLARTVVRPIRDLTESVDALRLGHFDRRVPVASTDELGRLAREFNRMAEALSEFRRSNLGEVVRAKDTLETTLAALPEAVIVVDPDGQIASLNPLAQAVLRAAGATPATRLEHLPIAAEDRRAVAEALLGLRSNGGPSPSRRTVSVTLDGRACRFALAVVPIPGLSGGRHGAVIVLTDVTDFVRLDELRAELIALVSHELKTPLTTLRMNLLLLGERPEALTPRQRGVLAAAIAGCEDLAGTIDELLDLSRIEAGQLRLALAPVDLSALVDQAVRRFQPRYAEAGVDLLVRGQGAGAVALGDAPRLALVVSNLLSNALNYSHEGGQVSIGVSSRQNARAEGPDTVQVAVTDTGPGIPEEFRERVFEKFFRVEGPRAVRRTGVAGAGFGLYLCRQIMEAHGGIIRCEAGEQGRGTTMTLELPAVPPSEGRPVPDGAGQARADAV